MSFIIFSYGDIQWGEEAYIDFFDDTHYFGLPESHTSASVDIDTKSNIGVPGLFVYRVDKNTIMEPTSNYTGKYLAHKHVHNQFFINKLFRSRNLYNPTSILVKC